MVAPTFTQDTFLNLNDRAHPKSNLGSLVGLKLWKYWDRLGQFANLESIAFGRQI